MVKPDNDEVKIIVKQRLLNSVKQKEIKMF